MPELYDHLRAEILLRAAEPIAHHAQTYGNMAVVMRRKVRLENGELTEVPILTADTMRHGLREAAGYALLAAAGIGADELTESALRFLFAGGVIGGSGSGINLAEHERLCVALPHLPLFGGCVGNRQLPGQLAVYDARLVCEETVPTLPAWVRERLTAERQQIDGARSHVELQQRVRMDPSLRPEMRRLLTPGERSRVEGRLLASEAASVSEDAVAAEKSKSTMMPRTYERVIEGSLFFWAVEVRLYSEIQRDTFLVAMRCFLEHALVGGKRGTGNGLLVPIDSRGVTLLPMASRSCEMGLVGPDQVAGKLFRRHVEEHAEETRTALRELVA